MNQQHPARRQRVRKQLRKTLKLAEPILTAKFGKAFSETVIRESVAAHETLIPGLPDIGDTANPLNEALEEMTGALAIFQVMKRHGKSAAETGELLQEVTKARIGRFPRPLRLLIGRLYMSRHWQRRARHNAAISQKGEYPGNFVYEVVAGDGESFDWGVDYTECGIVKFYQSQGADEFIPFVCELDNLLFPAMGIELERTGTIGQGCDRCDFRYRKTW